MPDSKLKFALEDGVARLTLNDPATLNALSFDLAAELSDALGRLESGVDEARALLITGEGRAFCSGANLATSPDDRARDAEGRADLGAALEAVYNPLMLRLRDLSIPIVTAVNGAAAGIGCSLALMGDLVVAGESAYFLQAFVRIGLAPDGGATWMLPRLVGRARAMELALLGERLPASKALDWGLINRCVPDAELIDVATALARQLAQGPKALGLIRRLMWEGAEAGFEAQLAAERRAQHEAGLTADFAEGVQAFFQKRPPAFQGR